MPVKPVPSAIGGLVMGVDVAAAGSGSGSVVVLGEGDAWRPEALGARWLPALRRDGMRLNIPIHYPLLEPMWMFLGMHLGMQP